MAWQSGFHAKFKAVPALLARPSNLRNEATMHAESISFCSTAMRWLGQMGSPSRPPSGVHPAASLENNGRLIGVSSRTVRIFTIY